MTKVGQLELLLGRLYIIQIIRSHSVCDIIRNQYKQYLEIL